MALRYFSLLLHNESIAETLLGLAQIILKHYTDLKP
jgi:hypothetical protein